MSAAFVDGLDSAGGEDESNSFLKLWDVDALFLEIWVLSNRPCRVKLGSAGSVGVTSTHLGTLLIYWANSRHNQANLHDIIPKCKLISSSR